MSGGILGGLPQGGGGILGGFNEFVQSNPSALLGLSAGLLSGDWGAGMQGFQHGMRQDQLTRQARQKQAEEALKKQKAQELATQYGLPAGLDADPDRVFSLVGQLEAQKRAPEKRSLTEQWLLRQPEEVQNQYFQRQVFGDGEKWQKLNDGTLFNPNTAEIREVGGSIRPMTPEERTAFAIPPETGAYIGPGGKPVTLPGTARTNVTVGGAATPLRKKLDEKEGENWGAFKESAAVSGALKQDMEIIDELVRVAPQGPIVGRVAQMFPGVSTAGAAFDAIVKRVAPSLRTPGSGSTSDIEYEGMIRSLPNLRNRPEANILIADVVKKKAEINIRRGEIVTAFQNGYIDEQTARQELDKLNRVSILSPELRAMIGGLGSGDNQGVTSGGIKWSVE